MDYGTALYESGPQRLFVANLVGLELSFAQQMVVFFTRDACFYGCGRAFPAPGMVPLIGSWCCRRWVCLPEAIAIPAAHRPATGYGWRTAVQRGGDMVLQI